MDFNAANQTVRPEVMAEQKWCVRCTQPGHRSHACPQPNPKFFTKLIQ